MVFNNNEPSGIDFSIVSSLPTTLFWLSWADVEDELGFSLTYYNDNWDKQYLCVEHYHHPVQPFNNITIIPTYSYVKPYAKLWLKGTPWEI